MMDTCCNKWDPSRRSKKYIKSGHGLGPFPQVQVMSIFVQIYGSGLHIFGQKSGLGQLWDMSRSDGHMFYQMGPL